MTGVYQQLKERSGQMTPFENNISSTYGDKGKQWLADLPHRVSEVAELWRLSDLKPVANLSYNYVLVGFRGMRPIILKLGCEPKELNKESAALKAFAGYGAVQLLEERVGALLLERAMPGESLKATFPNQDDEGIQITCKVMKQLHQAPIFQKEMFPHLRDWLTIIDKDWEIPEPYLKKARQLKDQLLATSPEPVLLHGDLHHENILRDGEHWVVIDPKGVIGDPVFEVAAFVRNPSPELLTPAIIEKRIRTFAYCLKTDETRICQWCFVGSVLSWLWGIEDGIDLTSFTHLPEIFYRFVKD